MERNYSIDTLRTLAMILVFLVHVSANDVVSRWKQADASFWLANSCDALGRVAVPIFVLISGRFLLGRPYPGLAVFRKTLLRILLPLLVWTVVYIVYKAGLSYISGASMSWQLLKKASWPFYHLWYLSMVAGLYCLIPLITHLIRHYSRTWVLTVALAFLALGIGLSIAGLYGLSLPDFLECLKYIGYFMLGYLLKDSPRVNRTLLLVIFLTCSMGTALLNFYALRTWNSFYFYNSLSPFVILAALALYKWFSQWKTGSNLLSALAPLSFGVYLIHAGALDFLNWLLFQEKITFLNEPFIGIPVKLVIVLLTSLFLSALIYRVRSLRRLI